MSTSKDLREMATAVVIAQAILPWCGPLAWYASLFLDEPAKKLRKAAKALENQDTQRSET